MGIMHDHVTIYGYNAYHMREAYPSAWCLSRAKVRDRVRDKVKIGLGLFRMLLALPPPPVGIGIRLS